MTKFFDVMTNFSVVIIIFNLQVLFCWITYLLLIAHIEMPVFKVKFSGVLIESIRLKSEQSFMTWKFNTSEDYL